MRRGIVGLGLVTVICVCVSAATAVAGEAPPTNVRLVIFSSPGLIIHISPAGKGDPRHVKTATGIRCGAQCSRVFPVGTRVTVRVETVNKGKLKNGHDEKGVLVAGPRGVLSIKACEGKTTCSFAMPATTRTYFKTVFCDATLSVAQCRAYIAKFLGYP